MVASGGTTEKIPSDNDEIVEHHTKNESKKYYKRIQDIT